jgi:hypothetical protein
MGLTKYKQWIINHFIKHKQIIDKLNHLNDKEIIKYFRYDNLKTKEKDFCPLFKQNKKCHNIANLNCYLCGCPYIKITKTKSYCAINSKFARYIDKGDFIHLDCSNCIIPHKEGFIIKHFDKNWSSIMKDIIDE